MPNGQVPERFHDILTRARLGHLATISQAGRPEVNPVWFLWDGEHILLSVKAETRKYRNLMRNPNLAISFADPEHPSRYLEIRGQVIDSQRQFDLSFVNQLAQKHTGTDYSQARVEDERYKLTIAVNSWTGQDA